MTEENNGLASARNLQSVGSVETDLPYEIIKHAKNPKNFGIIQEPDSQATLVGADFDSVSVQLHLSGVVIDDISFQTRGGGYVARACASIATELVKNKPLSHALTLTGSKIDSTLGGLPLEYKHCADLAAKTIKAAAENAVEHLSDSLKRMYLG